MIYILIPFVIIIFILIIIIVNKKNSIITKNNEYWVADMDIISHNNDKYEYTAGTELIAFHDNEKCEVLIMNLDDLPNGNKVIPFYDKELQRNGPKGAYVSFRSNNCNYKLSENEKMIIINYNYDGNNQNFVGSYKIIDNDTIIINWSNSNVKDVSYIKVDLSEYVEDGYLYSGEIGYSFASEIKEISIDKSEINNYKGYDGKNYLQIDELLEYLKKKYEMYIDKNDFLILNSYNESIYYDSKKYYSFDIDGNSYDFKILLRVLNEKELKEKINNTKGEKRDIVLKDHAYYGSDNIKEYEYYVLYHFDDIEAFKELTEDQVIYNLN